MYSDPELADEYLTLYVRQEEYSADIMDRIDAIAAKHLAELDGANGHLLLTTDFRRPRG
jgi:hypothetical protein